MTSHCCAVSRDQTAPPTQVSRNMPRIRLKGLVVFTLMSSVGSIPKQKKYNRRVSRQISVYTPAEDPEEDHWTDLLEKEEGPLYNYYHTNVVDQSYNFSYDTGWSSTGRSFRFEERRPNGDVSGEFGWVDKPEGTVRVTKYTADRRGYRTRQFVKRLERMKRKEEEELLIVGPIPPFLKESHLAANPGAILSDGPDLEDIQEEEEEVEELGEEENEEGDGKVEEERQKEKVGEKRRVVVWGEGRNERLIKRRRGRRLDELWEVGESGDDVENGGVSEEEEKERKDVDYHKIEDNDTHDLTNELNYHNNSQNAISPDIDLNTDSKVHDINVVRNEGHTRQGLI